MRLAGKAAVVTGAGSRRGIGRAIALGFAREGADVAVADIDLDGVVETAAAIREMGRRALAVQMDVSKAGDARRLVSEAVEAFGKLDIAVNNAGFCRFVPFLDVTEELWDRIMAVNLKGYFLVGQEAARQMVRQGHGGKIINLSSQSAEVAGEEKVHYCVSKAGIKLLTKGMALELARYKINVNDIAPGTIDTDIIFEDRIKQLVEAERQHSTIPWGRMGTPEDVVGAAVFLASPESDYLTGSEIRIDGGCTAGTTIPPQFRAARAG